MFIIHLRFSIIFKKNIFLKNDTEKQRLNIFGRPQLINIISEREFFFEIFVPDNGFYRCRLRYVNISEISDLKVKPEITFKETRRSLETPAMQGP